MVYCNTTHRAKKLCIWLRIWLRTQLIGALWRRLRSHFRQALRGGLGRLCKGWLLVHSGRWHERVCCHLRR